MKKKVLSAGCIGFAIAAACSTATAAANICNYSTSQRTAWAAYLSRALHNHDPDHAAQMSKVASAIIHGQTAVVMAQIDSGLDPNTLLKLGSIPALDMPLLTLAAAACQNRLARQLIAAGASVNAADPPLATAAGKGDVPLAAFLIEKGASLDQVDPDGKTALYNAIALSQPGMVKLLLAKGAKADVPAVHAYLGNVSHSSNPADQAVADELRKYLHAKH